MSVTVGWYLEGLEHNFLEPLISANKSFPSKSWYLPLVIFPHWMHLFDFGKMFRADLKQALLPAP